MLSFPRFVEKRQKQKRKKHIPTWKHAKKYSHAAWTLFGLTVHPEDPARVRTDTLQGRLQIRAEQVRQRHPGYNLAQIEILLNDNEFINAFYTDSPEANTRQYADIRYRGVADSPAWTEMFPATFFARTHTDEIGTVQTYGAPVRTAPVRYMLGQNMAYCMMQELFEYRRRYELQLYQNRLFSEMDLLFADSIIHPITARIYDLNGTVYVMFGEVHTPAPCYRRTRNAITTGKFFVDLVAACPDVRFDMFTENGSKTYLPAVHRGAEFPPALGAGGSGAGGFDYSKHYNTCQDRSAFFYYERKNGLEGGRTIDDIDGELQGDGEADYNPQRDDAGILSTNEGFLSASTLYFFTAFPSAHAWKSKGILGNVRLHLEDVRSLDRGMMTADNKANADAKRLLNNPRFAPIRESLREVALGRAFTEPTMKLGMERLISINFRAMTMTFRRDIDPVKLMLKLLGKGGGRGAAGLFGEGMGGEVGRFLQLMNSLQPAADEEEVVEVADDDDDDDEEKAEFVSAGCRIISTTDETIVVSFERILMKKFRKLAPDTQARLQTAFQQLYDEFEPLVARSGIRNVALEAMVIDFYAIVRSFVDTSGGQGRKRVVMFQAGSMHVEFWSSILHKMGATEFVYGSPRDYSSHRKVDTFSRINMVDLDAMRQRLVALDVLRPRMVFTTAEREIVRDIYGLIDEVKSMIIRPDTVEEAWNLMNRIVEPEDGLFRACIREVFKSVEDSAGEDGRTTNNRPFELLAMLGTKIKLTLEMFIVDLTTLQDPSATTGAVERVLASARFHTGNEKGSLSARIQQLTRNLTEGVFVSKRKR